MSKNKILNDLTELLSKNQDLSQEEKDSLRELISTQSDAELEKILAIVKG